ncbi:MAG TPA: dolichol-phosphate mannosyltransferase, partial [Alphaproteobacteria bacterium]
TMDGDLQNDPADIPGLYHAYQQAVAEKGRPVFVIGQRAQRHDDWLRCATSKTANRVRQYLLKDNTRDSGCAVRLCRREDYLSLPFFNNMHRFISALAMQNGFPLVLVDISHRPRVAGVAKYGFWNRLCPGIVDMFGLLWLNRRRRRLSSITHY